MNNRIDYNKLITLINNEATGIAKGYDISFLQEKFTYTPNAEERFHKLIENDLKLFATIQESSLLYTEPKEGDYVEYEEGMFAKISRIHDGGKIQISNGIGVYASKSGSMIASGAVYDFDIKIDETRLLLENLESTDELKQGECWTFSEGNAGASRGVYYNINFKVWKLA